MEWKTVTSLRNEFHDCFLGGGVGEGILEQERPSIRGTNLQIE